MDSLVIRPLEQGELQQVSRQIAQSYKHAYATLMDKSYLASLGDDHWVPILEEGLRRGDSCLIAEKDGEIVGSVVYGPSEKDPHSAEWHAIYLSPDQIGKGVGHALILAMERQMVGQGFQHCRLEVLVDNHRAIRFYQDHGYAVTDTFTVDENNMSLTCYSMAKSFAV